MRLFAVLALFSLIGCSQYDTDRHHFMAGEAGSISDDDVTNTDNGTSQQAGVLTAGEWNDNANWDFWLDLITDPAEAHGDGLRAWSLDMTNRVTVNLHNDGGPIIDEAVRFIDAQGQTLYRARTNVDGIAQLFPTLTADAIGPFSITVGDDESSPKVDDLVFPITEPVELIVGAEEPEPVLDLMFVIDTTGSMGDELAYLQTELSDVISQSRRELLGQTDLRLSVNFYRDHGDEYVTRDFPFTTDISTAIHQLQQQDYDGGGDWPEAVDAALFSAIHLHQWSPSAQARLLFLVLDAPHTKPIPWSDRCSRSSKPHPVWAFRSSRSRQAALIRTPSFYSAVSISPQTVRMFS